MRLKFATLHCKWMGPDGSLSTTSEVTDRRVVAGVNGCGVSGATLWRVVNPNVLGPLGNPVSYQLQPGSNAISLLSPDDFPQRRAGFTD